MLLVVIFILTNYLVDLHFSSQDLNTRCNELQAQKTRLLYNSSVVQSLPDDDVAHEQLKQIEERWSDLVQKIASSEHKLSTAKLSLLPSTQAAEELEIFVNDVHMAMKADEALRPKSIDEVRDLCNKYTVWFFSKIILKQRVCL